MKKTVILISVFLLLEIPGNAQFLNRLKNSIQRGAEEAVLNKAEEEAYKQTSKALEKMLRERLKNFSMDSLYFIPKDSLPPRYDFGWNYQLSVSSDDEQTLVDYFLYEGGGYFGTATAEATEMKMVLDNNLKAFITYMENDGEKTAMAMRFPNIEINEEDSLLNSSFTFEKTGNTREILGYTCEEFIGENPEYKYTMYITQDTEVGFGDFFKMDQNRIPAGFDPEWIKAGKGMMMEMEMIDKNKKKNNMSMTCTKLEAVTMTLNNDEYEFMEFPSAE
ncbi:MAG: DUF4412 domain-containing protein [Cyclobacteriaceae bacterium]|nr:DUF4412 domain-containing protein [Cyclobacteriaceae bacterium]